MIDLLGISFLAFILGLELYLVLDVYLSDRRPKPHQGGSRGPAPVDPEEFAASTAAPEQAAAKLPSRPR